MRADSASRERASVAVGYYVVTMSTPGTNSAPPLTMSHSPQPSSHTWKFFRTGGLDQVSLKTSDDLLALRHLDQKLWVALSCPVKGLELDDKTLARVDSDNDGRIRVPELIHAVEWAASALKDPAELLSGHQSLPLASIDDSTAEGKVLVSSARQILANLGRKDAKEITVEDAADTAKIFSTTPLKRRCSCHAIALA